MDYYGSKGSVAEIAKNIFVSKQRQATTRVGRKRPSFVAPLWTTVMGWDYKIMNKLIEHGLFVSDFLEIEPEYCLASRNRTFTVVQSSPFMAKQFNDAEGEEGYVWQLVESDTTALENAQRYTQYAALCTKSQARAYGLYEMQDLHIENTKQVCGLILEGQVQKLFDQSILYLEFSSGKTSAALSFVSAFMKQAGVEISDLSSFPGRENGYLLMIDADYKQARVRKAFNQFLDLGLGKVLFLGGKQKVEEQD